MSGADSDTMQLVDVRRSRGRRGKRNRNRHRWRRGVSDSEMRDDEDEFYEDDTYFSEGDSLPSIRAQLASSLRYRKSVRDEEKESTPLLDHQRDNGAGVSTQHKGADSPSSGYESLPPLPSKPERWGRVKLWYNRSKIVVLTVFLVTCVALFAVNEEKEKNTFFVTVQNSEPECILHYIITSIDCLYQLLAITSLINGPYGLQTVLILARFVLTQT